MRIGEDGLTAKQRYRVRHSDELLEKHREYNRQIKASGKDFIAHLKYYYNLSLEQYYVIWERQKGICAIETCAWKLDSGPRRPHLDHDHKCCKGNRSCGNCIRGLLCFRHNRALGDVDDSVEELKALEVYLKGWVIA